MRIADLAVKRPVMMTVIVLVFVLFGYLGFKNLSLNLMPDVSLPYVTVQTIYPGAGPSEIETLITKKIEDAIATIEGIDNITSYSLDGVSLVLIEFALDKNVDVANQETKDKIDQILNSLPSDAKLPIVSKIDFRAAPVADLVLSGDFTSIELYEFADKIVKNQLSQIKGVANVSLAGGQERNIQVRLSDRVIYENMISLPALMGSIAQQNIDLPAGTFNIGNQEYSVRVEGQFDSISTISETHISSPFGLKKIREIAQVADAGKKIKQRSIYFDVANNQSYANTVRIGLVKSPDGNIVDVVDKVKEELPLIQKQLPSGTKLEIINEDATFVKSSVDDTLSNIYLGVLLTALILFIFLHDWRSTLIAAVTMPSSIISSFMFFDWVGIDLNMMSLLGLSVTIGVLVANSVVIIENVFRYKEMGLSTFDATVKGTNEVFIAVLASTLTNLVVFVPLASLDSIVGQFLRNLALAASFATLFSLIYSFILTPMLTNLLISDKPKKKNAFDKVMDKFDSFYINIFEKTIKVVIKNKVTSFITLLGTVILFVIVMVVFGSKLGFEFRPAFDQGLVSIIVELPVGYNLEATTDVVSEIKDKLKHHPEVEKIVAEVGKSSNIDIGSNLAAVSVYLCDSKKRDKSMDDLAALFTKDLANLKNAKISVAAGAAEESGAMIELYIIGHNKNIVQKLANESFEKLRSIPGLINFDISTRTGKPEISIYPKRDKLAEVGLSVSELAITLRTAVEGMAQTKFKEDGEEYDITILMDKNFVDSPEKIKDLPVVTRSGVFKLSDLADIKFTAGPTKILHKDKYLTIRLTGANAPGVPLGDITSEIDKRMAELNFPEGYSYAWGGSAKIFQQMMMDLAFAFALGILLTYLLLAAMLESFIQPVYIMMTIPLGLIGVVLIAYFTNTDMSITALMGVILLTGIVVNNAILILDFTNQLVRDEGKHIKDALVFATISKLKPILMSNAALALGMLPLALGMGDAGVEIRQPLGIVSIGGIIASTILTLYIIPAFYLLLHKEKKTA